MYPSSPTVVWETLGNDGEGHNERFTLTGFRGLDRLCFNRFARTMETVNPEDTIREIIPGYYYISSPRFSQDSLTVELRMKGPLLNKNYMPDGFHAVLGGKPVTVKATRKPLTLYRSHWSTIGKDLMPYGDDIFRFNESLRSSEQLGPYDVIPSFKSVKLTGEGVSKPNPPIHERGIKDERKDFYRITVTDSVLIEFTSPESRLMARRVLGEKILPFNPEGLPYAVIEDYPSLEYRGFMMDIARNFFTAADLQRLAHLMASYRMNRLHFHFADDEAWRLEIPGLPELTDVGARRGYTLDEKDHLAQIFSGNGSPDDYNGTANGYITRREFIDFLRYCNSLGICVVPEIESPGHARAAIRSTQARARRTGDTTYLLSEESDSSTYTSAQAFHDNVMNPALPGPYRFMEKVIDELIAMYDEAGAPLIGIHIGGDEVAKGAWNGSEAVRRLGFETEKEVHDMFVDSIASMLDDRGIPMHGWQETALGNNRNASLAGGINCWTLANSGISEKVAELGYPVIISNVNHFYLDQCYNYHPEEQGLTWGGTVDEFQTFRGYPYRMSGADPKLIRGVSGHLFGETLRKFDQVQYLLLPKMLGLAERAWNPEETITEVKFNQIIGERELPSLARRGLVFHLRQPGLIVENGVATMNSPYPSATIRYTLDGSEPTASSPVYCGQITLKEGETPRARLFYLGRQSLTTFPRP